MSSPSSLRDRIASALVGALGPLANVLAGWEGGSAAFGALDEYSDLDLSFLVDDGAALEELQDIAARALDAVSPIVATHDAPPGKYYKLEDSGEFLLVDLIFVRASDRDRGIEDERHGHVRALFDKGNWLAPRPCDKRAVAERRADRLKELATWFPISQSFVRKAILRGRKIEALSAFWGYTVRPLAELLRMRHSPARWDFGTRYLERDLPAAIHEQFLDLVYVGTFEELDGKLAKAAAWGSALLRELGAN